ncbi:trypsin domain-containing protein [Phthorimaea operculella]|nr:trypsin domain-containing protein [Phthorimaea operculella]
MADVEKMEGILFFLLNVFLLVIAHNEDPNNNLEPSAESDDGRQLSIEGPSRRKQEWQYEGIPIDANNRRSGADPTSPEPETTTTSPTIRPTPPLNHKYRRIFDPDEKATIEDFPFMAAILMNNELWCGGAIIDKDRVLTAAHCLQLRIFKFNPDEKATIEDFPFMAAILMNNELWCGGAIIDKDRVLTAAHCLQLIFDPDEKATIEDFPFMAAILMNNELWCGGAIIDKDRVLTAAHCLQLYFLGYYVSSFLATVLVNSQLSFNHKYRRIFDPDEKATIEDFLFMAAILMNNELWCGGAIIDKDRVLTAAHCLQLQLSLYHKYRRIFDPDEKATIEDFPFMAAILMNNELWCGGAIIDKDRVLTAAHCLQLQYNNRFFREYVKMLTVRVGSTNATDGGEVLRVVEITFHPNYKPSTLEFNVAVLKLHKNLSIGSEAPIQDIEYAKKNFLSTDNNILFLGWGSVLGGGGTGGTVLLQKVELPVYEFGDCQNIYGRELVTHTNFCAGFISKRKNVCNHDAGGPAVIGSQLVGVLSFSAKRCDNLDHPAVFTSVGSVAPWLDELNEPKPTFVKVA